MQLTVQDVAKLLNVSQKTIYRWITQGSLPAYRVNDQYRFSRAELLEWATGRRINVAPEIFQEIESSSIATPALVDALQAGGIFYRIVASDRESALRAIVDQARLPDEVDREFLYRVLLAREQLATTAVGGGIAFPHVRNPVVPHITRPSVSLCFLEKAIDYGALDGKPVHAFFTIMSPTVRAQLELMSKLAFAVQDEKFSALIRERALREEILREAARIESILNDRRPPA
jgi:nitrogen PTS system EIIA component